jgi:hypothetical protein
MARSNSYFSALDMDEPEFQLGPSLIAGGATSASEGAGSAAPSHGAAGAAGPALAAASSAGFDLSAVADEILAQSNSLPATSEAKAWDFSGLATTTAEEREAMEKEAVEREKARKATVEARLAALHERERAELAERLHMAEVSHKQRVRRLEAKVKGEVVVERMASKFDRKLEAKKRRNQAKHAY